MLLLGSLPFQKSLHTGALQLGNEDSVKHALKTSGLQLCFCCMSNIQQSNYVHYSPSVGSSEKTTVMSVLVSVVTLYMHHNSSKNLLTSHMLLYCSQGDEGEVSQNPSQESLHVRKTRKSLKKSTIGLEGAILRWWWVWLPPLLTIINRQGSETFHGVIKLAHHSVWQRTHSMSYKLGYISCTVSLLII